MTQHLEIPGTWRHVQAIERIRSKIAQIGLACSGTLHTRKKCCGRPNCRCAKGKDYWHGPYHEWTRRRDGKLVHTILAPEQLEILEPAIANYREIQELLSRWDRETEAIVLNARKRKS